jgi:hypothetical protein
MIDPHIFFGCIDPCMAITCLPNTLRPYWLTHYSADSAIVPPDINPESHLICAVLKSPRPQLFSVMRRYVTAYGDPIAGFVRPKFGCHIFFLCVYQSEISRQLFCPLSKPGQTHTRRQANEKKDSFNCFQSPAFSQSVRRFRLKGKQHYPDGIE